jgi:hypothetical protein
MQVITTKHKKVCNELENVDSIVGKLRKKIIEQEEMFSQLRRYLTDLNVRMLYKMLNVKMPTELKEELAEKGAVFFDLVKSQAVKANKFEVKTMASGLGLLETGLIKEPQKGPKHPEFGKFEGFGLEESNMSDTEMQSEIKRLRE